MNKTLQRSLLLIGAAGFLFFGANRLLHYNENRALQGQQIRLSRAIEAGDRLVGHGEAVRHYRDLKPQIPEVQLRILQRQWLIALEMLDEIRTARSNPFLAQEVPRFYDRLTTHLADMEERCDLLLAQSPSLTERVTWRVFNVRAAVKIVASLVVLETENNWKKVRGRLQGARSDLTSAMDMVDRTAASSMERNICRWNLEILAQQEVKRARKSAEGGAEHRLELRENLEAIIPEKGGFAAGKGMLGTMKK